MLSKGKLIYDGTLDQLKHRYVTEKMVRVTGREREERRLLLPEARITAEGRTTKVVYQPQQYSSEEVLHAVTRAFEIEDITIQEPDIDEVVSRIFQKGEGT